MAPTEAATVVSAQPITLPSSSNRAPDIAHSIPTIVSAYPTAVSSSLPTQSKTPEAPEGMALVPAGPFVMGADHEGELDERPAHEVTLRAFFLDLTEVTNEAYHKCVDAGVCRPHDPGNAKANKVGEDREFRKPRQPISAVSWEDATTYCRWIDKRLPTEAEWEKAARGTDGRKYPWGAEFPTHEHAVFGEGTTAEVGSRPKGKGPYGHLDLAGNVWEWVNDFYDPYAYQRPHAAEGIFGTCEETMDAFADLRRRKQQGFTGSNPIPSECEKGLRGGAFNYHARGLRSSNRVHHPGRFRLVMSGFRCAKDVSISPGEVPP